MLKKVPNPIDRHVGSRVRMRRMLAGVSQEKLGEALGLTFQQVQKYEKGANRISASRLQQIAKMLEVPVSFFFDGAPSGDAPEGAGDRVFLQRPALAGCAHFRPPGRVRRQGLHFRDEFGRIAVCLDFLPGHVELVESFRPFGEVAGSGHRRLDVAQA